MSVIHDIVPKFSTGYIWFYWPYKRDWQPAGLENDFGGYTSSQLYVPCKYNTYKEEILSHISKKKYDLMKIKADLYFNFVKSL